MALLGAIILWFFIMNEQNPIAEATYTVPVHVQNLSQKYVVENAPQQVTVTLRGPRNTILTLNQHTLRATVDLADVQVGQQNVDILFTPPTGMVLVSQSQLTAQITVDDYAVKEMTLQVQQSGKLPDDIGVKDIKLVPQTVAISGPQTLVNQVTRVIIPARMDDRRTNFTTSGPIEALDANGNAVNVTVTPRQGQAQIDLERIRFDKSVPVTVGTTGTPAAGFRVREITVQPQQVVVSGREAALAPVTGVRTVNISLDNVTSTISGDYDIMPVDGVTMTPARVHVVIEIERNPAGAQNATTN